jgi:hypothetical protein
VVLTFDGPVEARGFNGRRWRVRSVVVEVDEPSRLLEFLDR